MMTLSLFDLPQKPEKPQGAYPQFIDVWCKKFPVVGIRMPRDGKCIKSLIQQTGDILGRMGVPDSEDKRVEFWSILLDNLPEWYKGQQLTVIDSHFTSIVHKILEHAKDRTIQKAVTKYKLG